MKPTSIRVSNFSQLAQLAVDKWGASSAPQTLINLDEKENKNNSDVWTLLVLADRVRLWVGRGLAGG